MIVRIFYCGQSLNEMRVSLVTNITVSQNKKIFLNSIKFPESFPSLIGQLKFLAALWLSWLWRSVRYGVDSTLIIASNFRKIFERLCCTGSALEI